MATFIIPPDGSSVKASEFSKAADEAVKRHQASLNDQQRKDGKHELDLLDDAIACAKQLARSSAFSDSVYAVVSSANESTAFPVGSGAVVDIRVESRAGAPEQQPAPQPKPMTRAEARRLQREGRNVASTTVAGAQVAPAPTPYMPGSRPEEIAAGRPLSAVEHTVVPPATGGGAYMPGSRAEEIAARRPLATGGTVPATQEEADRNARMAVEQTMQAGQRAGRSTKRGGNRKAKSKGTRSRSSAARKRPATTAPATTTPMPAAVNTAPIVDTTSSPKRTAGARPARARAPKSNA